MYSLGDGERLVKAARQAIELNLLSPRFRREMLGRYLDGFDANEGVFVTLEHYVTGEPRGSMGVVSQELPLGSALIDAAVFAATNDPVHIPVSHQELEHVVVRVSVLTDMKQIKAKTEQSLKREIKPGTNGLSITSGFHGAVMLPWETPGQRRNAEDILSSLCEKAGLQGNAWRSQGVELYKFHAQTFKELYPGDSVEEIR